MPQRRDGHTPAPERREHTPQARARWLAGWRAHARSLGFSAIGVADVDLSDLGPGLRAWIDAGFHGEMDWMARHAALRLDPGGLLPGTASALIFRTAGAAVAVVNY